jgi:hypothetical protein
MNRRLAEILAATLATLALALLGSLQSSIWNGANAPGFARAIALAVEPDLSVVPPSAGLPQPTAIYFVYGRLVIATYLLVFLAAAGARYLVSNRLTRLLGGLGALALIGDVLAYWISASVGPSIRRVGFWYIEMPALLLVAAILSGIGVAHLRHGRPGRVLVCALPLAVLATAALRYLPHGVLFGISFTFLLALLVNVRATSDAFLKWRNEP